MNTHDLSPEDSARVAEIRKALMEEMTASRESKTPKAIEDVMELKPDALQSLQHIVRHSPNESLKARVSMWTIDKIIEAEKVKDDPLAEFLQNMPQTPETVE
jgi:hypothetical protein